MDKGDMNDRLNRLSLEPRHHQEAEAAAGKSYPSGDLTPGRVG